MKRNISLITLGLALSVAAVTASAQTIVSTSYFGMNDSSQIVPPTGFTSVVLAQNIGDTQSSLINGITFAGDSAAALDGGQNHLIAGNGYSANAAWEDSGGVSGALFTQTTLNLGNNGNPGGLGYVIGNPLSGLSPDTDYAFELFLSDNNAGRGVQLSYSLGGGSSTAVGLVQNLGAVNVYEVKFNTGSADTFNWRVDATADLHDSKISGFALFEPATVPEPGSIVLASLGGFALLFFLRRK